TYHWFSFWRLPPDQSDSSLYSWLNGSWFDELIGGCETPTSYSDTRFFISFGPFDSLKPGDTLKITFGLVSGLSVDLGPGSMSENATRALILHDRGWVPEQPLPPPQLRVSQDTVHTARLAWGRFDTSEDPAAYWDPSSITAGFFPTDHW